MVAEKIASTHSRPPIVVAQECTLCYCPLEKDEDKFEFECGKKHIFHTECIQDMFTDFIERGETHRCACPSLVNDV